MGKDAKLVRTIDTYYHDVDVNGHINSVKYIEHILDLFDLDYYKTHFLQRFEIAYVAESHQGDQLHFYLEETSEAEKMQEYCIKITKNGKNDANEVEVVRSKAEIYKKMKEKFGSFILISLPLHSKIKNKPRAAFLDRGWTDQTGSLWIRIQLASVWTSITRGSTNGKPHKIN